MFNRRVLKDWLHDTFLPIFLFRGIVEGEVNPILNYDNRYISRKDFQYMLYELQANGGQPLTIDEVLYWKESTDKRWPKRSYAVAFSDGLESIYSIAAPILDDMAVPAIFYIVSSHITSGLMSWEEQVKYCLMSIEGKGTINLPISERALTVESTDSKVGAAIKIMEELYSKETKGNLTEKHLLIDSYVRDLFNRNKVKYIAKSKDPAFNKLSWEQINDLVGNPLFTIGGHGANHRVLSYLTRMEALKEINTCRNEVEDQIGYKVRHFSYPGGQDIHYNKQVIELLLGCGIKSCTNTMAKPNIIALDNYNLRMVPVG